MLPFNQITFIFLISFALTCNVLILRASENDDTTQNPQHSTMDKCILPDYPINGEYSVWRKPHLRPGQSTDSHTILNYACNKDYVVSISISLCNRGAWSHAPKCIKMCDLPRSTTVIFFCDKEGKESPCDDKIEPGTVIKSRCVRNHFLEGPRSLRCNDGIWDNPVPQCLSDCGLQPAVGTSLILGGIDARSGEIPWHLGVYSYLKPSSDDENTPTQICGATLIARKIAISAAHCFWNEIEGKMYPENLYEIAAGKMYRDYKHPEDDKYSYVQITNVEKLLIPREYNGNSQQQQSDIVLIILEKSLDISNNVFPACLQLSDNQFDQKQLSNGALGMVAGWGVISEGGPPSRALKTTLIPVVDYDQCRKEMPSDWRRYLTNDKFCAGYLNGTGVCSGDSGGGLFFKSSEEELERWYIRGIVSVGVPSESGTCRINAYSGFTRIFSHAEWILNKTAQHISFFPNSESNFKSNGNLDQIFTKIRLR